MDDGERQGTPERHVHVFIDYKKAFDCVDHERLWVMLRDVGVPVHLIVLQRMLYTNQEATVRTEFGETYNIDIGKGVRQGCIFSPLLFNIYAENIMREALEEWESEIRVRGRMVTNLRYADDTTLLGVTLETKVELVKVLVFPIVLYGAETWTMRTHDRRKIDAFELWCWRR